MAYRDRWVAYFNALDANKTGFIQPSDAIFIGKKVAAVYGVTDGSPEYTAILNASPKVVDGIINACDADKDGKVSLEELLSGVENTIIGKTAHTLPECYASPLEEYFRAADLSHNGIISLEEMIIGIKKVAPHESEERVKNAYQWAAQQSSSGKYDKEALLHVGLQWATSPDPTPEADILIGYFLNK
jgi:Ca2+-binding EF-hand superfamily protein